jgi:hypothetical protein
VPTCPSPGEQATLRVDATGGVGNYSFSINAGQSYQNSNVFGGLSGGNYNVVVRDEAGCLSGLQLVTVADTPLPLSVSLQESIVACSPVLSISVRGGRSNFQTSLNGGQTFQAYQATQSLAAGTYQVVVRDANGCLSTPQGITLRAAPQLDFSVSVQNPSCAGRNDGTATITPTSSNANLSGFVYVIDGVSFPETGANQSLVRSNLAAGATFSVAVQHPATQCATASRIVKVGNPVAISISTQTTNEGCTNSRNGAVVLSASGGSGAYQYAIVRVSSSGAASPFPPVSNTTQYSGLTSGDYLVRATDSRNCTVSGSFSIGLSSNLSLTALATGTVCSGEANGSVQLSVQGANGTVSFALNSPQQFVNNSTFALLPAGNYTFFARDNFCTVSTTVVVLQPQALQLTAAVTPPRCAGQPSGSVTLNATGGSTSTVGGSGVPFTFFVNNISNGSNRTFQNLVRGFYTFAVRDARGCRTQTTVIINDPPPLNVAARVSKEPTCVSNSFVGAYNADGTLRALPSGGTPPYSYSLTGSFFQSSDSLTNLRGGRYVISIRDNNGCTAQSLPVVLSAPDPPVLTAIATPPRCFGEQNGSIAVSTTGGTPPFRYTLNNSIFFGSGLSSGTYVVGVADNRGCPATTTVILATPQRIEAFSLPDVLLCRGDTTTLNASAAQAPIQWLLGGSVIATTPTVRVSQPGTYTARASNATGCVVERNMTLTNTFSRLIPNLLLPEVAKLRDVVKVVEYSSPAPETVQWILPADVTEVAAPAGTLGTIDTRYVKFLKFAKEGTYEIKTDLVSQQACRAAVTKRIRIVNDNDVTTYDTQFAATNIDYDADQIIKRFVATPNPNQGTFKADIELEKEAEVQVRLFDEQLTYANQTARNSKFFSLDFELAPQAVSRMYYLMLEVRHPLNRSLIARKTIRVLLIR